MTINHTDPAELLAVVDSSDNEIGAERRDIIHRDHLLHRAIHLFIFRPDGQLLLQQRSPQKDMYPLHWECVGGHLSPGEKYHDCAIREAHEELGIYLDEITEITKLNAGPRTDFEFITVYTATTASPVNPDPAEIIATDWHTPAQWLQEIKTQSRLFSPTLIHTIESCPNLFCR